MKQDENNIVYGSVLRTISEYNLISENEHIVIGLSGGADSLCLFDILCRLSDSMNLKLYPVHINHGLREEACEDEKFCTKLCADKNIECRVYGFDCEEYAREKNISTEEAGRILRYTAFAEVFDEISRGGAPREKIKIAVAQNADDRAETVLFRIMRGTGTDGLVGIKHIRCDEKGRQIIRPLLDTYKSVINEYCELQGLNPQIDKTNFEEIYNRNRIRLSLIPLIEEKYNPEFKKALNRLALSAEEDRLFLENLACDELEKITKNFSKEANKIILSGVDISELDPSIRRRVIAQALKKIGMIADMGFAHYKACDDIISSTLPSVSVNLPNGYVICKEYEDIALLKADTSAADAYLERISVRNRSVDNPSTKNDSVQLLLLDADKLKAEYGENALASIKVRKRRPGDIMAFSFGHKKLQNLFVDRKIPKFDRDRIIILAIGSEVLGYFLVDENSSESVETKYTQVSDVLRLDDDTKTYISVELTVSV